MKQILKSLRKPVAIAASASVLALATPAALADDHGPWQVRLGVTHIEPKSDNGNLLPGDISVSRKVGPTINVAYFVSPNWAVDVLGGLPFEHDFSINGVKAGSTKHLPPVVSVQYHFAPKASIRPYVGVGANYTLFLDEKLIGGGNLKLKDSVGLAGQIGVDIPLTDRVALGFDARYIDIESKASVNGVSIGKVVIDPWVYSLNVSYRF